LNQTPVFLLIENWNTGACTLYDDDDDDEEEEEEVVA
jgi:hypothetical protein